MAAETLQLLNLSQLGLGTYSVSGVYGKKDSLFLKETIQQAYQRGITFFDTWDSYGRAEEFLGEVIKPFRKDICLSSKLGAGPDLRSHLSHREIICSCEKSLRRLQTDYLDIYRFHYHDPQVPVTETLLALEQLQQ